MRQIWVCGCRESDGPRGRVRPRVRCWQCRGKLGYPGECCGCPLGDPKAHPLGSWGLRWPTCWGGTFVQRWSLRCCPPGHGAQRCVTSACLLPAFNPPCLIFPWSQCFCCPLAQSFLSKMPHPSPQASTPRFSLLLPCVSFILGMRYPGNPVWPGSRCPWDHLYGQGDTAGP